MHSSHGFVLLDRGKYDTISTLQMAYISGEKHGNRKKRISEKGKALEAFTRRCAWPEIWQAIDPHLDRCPNGKDCRLAVATVLLRVPFVCFISPLARVNAGDHRLQKLHDESVPSATRRIIY